MGTAEKKAVKRLGRGLFSILIGVVSAYFTEQPSLIVLAPLLNTLGKYLREKFGLLHMPI